MEVYMDTFADYLRKSNAINYLYRTMEKHGIDASIDLLDTVFISAVDTTMYMDELSFKTSDKRPPQFNTVFLNLGLDKLILTQSDVQISKVIKLITEYPRWQNVPLVVYKDENGTHYLQDGHHRFAALHFLNVQQHVCEVFRKNENADEYNSFTVEKR